MINLNYESYGTYKKKVDKPLWEELYQSLLDQLRDILKGADTGIVIKAQNAVRICREIMQILQDHIVQYDFKDLQEEIYFFKEVKPAFNSQLLYYHKLYNLEIARPIGSPQDEQAYLKKELDRIKDFFDDNKFFYQYFRSDETYLDEKLFVRHQQDIPISRQTIDINANPAFTTNNDYIFSRIRANELLLNYLQVAIQETAEGKTALKVIRPTAKKLKWTDAKSALIEIIYAFKAKGSFNNGNATLKEISDYIQEAFDIEINNPSRDFQEILRRKSGYTIYIDGLKESYLKYIDAIEERPR